MHTQHAAAMSMLFMFAVSTQAQCPPQRLTSPSDFAGDFGFRLAMSDRHLLVGDWRDHTLCGDGSCANGYAWAYEPDDDDGGWVFSQRIEPADLGWSWGFGYAIALDGDRALITRTLGLDCNMVFEFEFDGQRWVEVGPICVPPLSGVDGSGVMLRGETALVRTLDGVLVYQEDGEGWALTHTLFNPDAIGEASSFGKDFDYNNDWLVVGAPYERITVGFGGAAYVYRRLPDGELELAQKLVAPDILNGPQFGSSVALDGDTLVVSGHISDRQFDEQGAVYVFRLVDGLWELEQELTHSEPARRDRFGAGLALEGNTLLIGASSDETPTSDGTVYLFRRGADGLWRETAALIPELQAWRFGFTPQLVGNLAAVGARDSPVGGVPTGSVDIFDLSCYLCLADLDGDGRLTLFDFLTFLNLFQDGDAQADFDGDGELTLFDFLAFQAAFDAGCQ
ncbi:MAG: GC-type dockerin domain-anchored protein [Phycisphaerales bacterium]